MTTQSRWMTDVCLIVLALGMAIPCLLPPRAQAANLYWDFGGIPNTNWTLAANWDLAADGTGGNPGAAPGVNDIAYFNVSTLNSAQIAAAGAISLQGLVINNTNTTLLDTDGANHAIALGSGGVTLNAGAGVFSLGPSGAPQNHRWGPINLSAPQTWANNSGNTWTLQNVNSIANGGFLLTIDGAGAFSFGTGAISGDGGLTKNGSGSFLSAALNTFAGPLTMNAGTLTLTGASTFTNTVTINGGTLVASTLANVNTASSIGKGSPGGSAADLVFGGGILQHTTASASSSDRLFTIGNTNGLTATLDSSANLAANTMGFTGAGSLAFGGSGARTLTLTGSNTGTNTFRPAIGDGVGGPTALSKSGPGAWILSGANTYTGGTTVSAGTLKLSGSGTLGAASGALTFSGGVLDLGGTSQSVGAVTIWGGSTLANGSLAGSTCTMQGGSLAVRSAAGLSTTQSFSSATIGECFAQILSQPNGGTNVLALGALTTTAGGGLLITNGAGGTVTTTSANDAAGILSGRIACKTSNWASANFAAVNGTGSIGANTNFIEIGGAFAPVAGSNDSITNHASLSAGGTINALRLAPLLSNRVLTMNGKSLVITSGGILLASDAARGFTLTAGGTLTAGSGNELIFSIYSSEILSIPAQLVDNGSAVAVTLVGASVSGSTPTMTLAANNTYSGGTFINSGALLVASNQQALGTGFVKLTDGTLQLAQALTVSSNLSGTSASVIDLGTNTLTASQVGNSTFAGSIINAGTLVKAGAGVLTLSGANTYKGGTTVQAGTLLVSNPSGSGTGTNAVTVQSGGTLGGTGLIAGTVTIQAGGTLNSGSPGASGVLTVSNLTLAANSTFAVNLASATSADRVMATGSLSFGGALAVIPVGGYSPAAGTQWTIATGTVSSVSFSSVTPGYQVVAGAASVVLRYVPATGTSLLIR